mgnify:CR=1 FL=1
MVGAVEVARIGGTAPQIGFEPRQLESGYARDDNYEWQSNQFARCYCQANPMAEDCAGVPAPQGNLPPQTVPPLCQSGKK